MSLKSKNHSIRPFKKDDLRQVANLHMKVFRNSHENAPPALISRFEEIFLNNPWCDQTITSLVYEDANDRIVGFLGVIPRQMSFDGSPIQAAVSTQFMVEPHGGYAMGALQLLNTFLHGPQELSLADEGNDSTRNIWEMLGGKTALLYSLRWTRPLRPIEYVVSQLIKPEPSRWPSLAVKSFSRPLDAIVTRTPGSPYRMSEPPFKEEALDGKTLLKCFSEFVFNNQLLRPDYDDDSNTWLLQTLSQKKSLGELQKVILRNEENKVVGSYLYYLGNSYVCQVVDVTAEKDKMNDVLKSLFHHAWRRGAIALSGRLAPQHFQEYSNNYCLFNQSYNWVLVHSRRPKLLHAILEGNASLTRLDGEWWLPIIGENFN